MISTISKTPSYNTILQYRSLVSVWTRPMRCTTFMPLSTRPNMVCFPSKNVVGARVIKNCEPSAAYQEKVIVLIGNTTFTNAKNSNNASYMSILVFGPLLAMERIWRKNMQHAINNIQTRSIKMHVFQCHVDHMKIRFRTPAPTCFSFGVISSSNLLL
jgi:hypothetical protein